ncbi:MAG: DUF6702 family protein [Ferruginibacter sp.]
MASILYKWFAIVFMNFFSHSFSAHPVFVSVTEIEHNAKEKTLEISCKIFTDDFEKTLRSAYHVHVDLLAPSEKAAMNKLVSDYVLKHLRLSVDGKAVSLKYLGYEQIEEGIYSYFQVDNVTAVKRLNVFNNILYEYKDQQMGLIHVIVNGDRKSTKLNNPDSNAVFDF